MSTIPLPAYLTELKATAYDGVWIKNILEMSSGVKFTEDENHCPSDIWKMWSAKMDAESETIAEYVMALKQRSEPPEASGSIEASKLPCSGCCCSL